MIIQSATVAVHSEYEAIGIDTSIMQNNYIIRTGVLMLLISLFSGVCTIGVGYLAAKTAAGTARDIRRALFERVERFSNYEFDKFAVSSLITRTTNDITQIQMLIVMVIRIVFYAPILGIGGIIIALTTAPSMWWTSKRIRSTTCMGRAYPTSSSAWITWFASAPAKRAARPFNRAT